MHRISLGINTEADGCICLWGGELGNKNKARSLLESQKEIEVMLTVGILKRSKKRLFAKWQQQKSLLPLLLKEGCMALVPETHGRWQCGESCLMGAMAQVTGGEDRTA